MNAWFLEQFTVGNVVTLVGLIASAGWHARRVVEVEKSVQTIATQLELQQQRRDADLIHIAAIYQRKDVQAESLASIDRQLGDIRETLREMRITKQH